MPLYRQSREWKDIHRPLCEHLGIQGAVAPIAELLSLLIGDDVTA